MKIIVGKDDFCSHCMKWCEYDEEGRCKICGRIIKKIKNPKMTDKYDDYGLDGSSDDFEIDFE